MQYQYNVKRISVKWYSFLEYIILHAKKHHLKVTYISTTTVLKAHISAQRYTLSVFQVLGE